MKKIDFVDKEFWLPDNIAIIGNSGNLLKSSWGLEIDKYSEIVRFNRAVVDGFEQQVGTRETIRVANNNVFDGAPLSEEDWGKQERFFIKNLIRDQKILYIGGDNNPWYNRGLLTHPSCSLYRFRYEFINVFKSYFGLRDIKQPTVGFIMVGLCVMARLTPSLFGFDVEDGGTRTHYFGKRPQPSGVHAIDEEKQIFRALEEKGKIRIYR